MEAHCIVGNTNIVVPPEFLPELRKIPDDMLSFPQATDNVSIDGDDDENGLFADVC